MTRGTAIAPRRARPAIAAGHPVIRSAEYHRAREAEIQEHAGDRTGGNRPDRLGGANRHERHQYGISAAVQHETAEVDQQEACPLLMGRTASLAPKRPE